MILDSKSIYNENINIDIKNTNFAELINKSYKNNLIDNNTYQLLLDKKEEMITLEIIGSDEENIEFVFNDIVFYLDNYLTNFETPYDAMYTFINDDSKKIIGDAKSYTNLFKKKIDDKITSLYNFSKIIYDNFILYKNTLIALRSKLENRKSCILYHSMLDIDLNNLMQIDKYVDSFIVETSIINKFDKINILRIIKILNDDCLQNWKNICESILYNYIYASLYIDNSENLHFSSNTCKIVISEMEKKNYEIEDFIEVIENGKIKFNDVEKKYIYDNFISKLEKYVNNKDNIYMFIKN